MQLLTKSYADEDIQIPTGIDDQIGMFVFGIMVLFIGLYFDSLIAQAIGSFGIGMSIGAEEYDQKKAYPVS